MVSVLVANQKITISAIDLDFSRSASETINCDYDDNEIKIGFNGINLLSVLQTIDDIDVKVLMKEPDRACIFTRACDDEKTQYISLLMPMRID
jgi:DNA polymerase-3 subunit beta